MAWSDPRTSKPRCFNSAASVPIAVPQIPIRWTRLTTTHSKPEVSQITQIEAPAPRPQAADGDSHGRTMRDRQDTHHLLFGSHEPRHARRLAPACARQEPFLHLASSV